MYGRPFSRLNFAVVNKRSCRAKYLGRICPKCGGNLGLVVSASLAYAEILPVIGCCMTCEYRLRWTLFVGRKRRTTYRAQK
jgi:hypothetical protein